MMKKKKKQQQSQRLVVKLTIYILPFITSLIYIIAGTAIHHHDENGDELRIAPDASDITIIDDNNSDVTREQSGSTCQVDNNNESLSCNNTSSSREMQQHDTASNPENDEQITNDPFVCRVFVAESTIPGAGLGVFAGVPFVELEILPMVGDVVIPLSPLARTSLINEYTWAGDTVTHAFSLGMGALPNCFYPLNNVHPPGGGNSEALRVGNIIHDDNKNNPNRTYDYVMDDYTHPSFSYNPGIGSSTIYYSKNGGEAARNIYAGEEIFIDYGTDYFTTRAESKFGLIPLIEDYRAADRMLHRFRNVANRVHARNNRKTAKSINIVLSQKAEEVTSATISLSENVIAHEIYELTKAVIVTWPSRVQGALPSEVTGVNHMLDVVKSTGMNYHSRSIRRLSDLQKDGICVDYIKSDKSTIPLAGNGAFANTFLPSGTTVALMPLIHIYDRSVLEIYEGPMFDGMLNEEGSEENWDEYDEMITKPVTNRKVIHHQLLLNYCFGHNESSIILCPYGFGGSLVNHAGPGYQANVKLNWSQKFSKKSEWFNQSIDEWKKTPYNGLAVEFVAIRDIEENEEILFDYGINWERAFFDHHPTEQYISSMHYVYHLINIYDDDPIELPIYQQQWTQQNLIDILSTRSKIPIVVPSNSTLTPSAIHIWCRTSYLRLNVGDQVFREFSDDTNYYPCRIIAKRQQIVASFANDDNLLHHKPDIYYTAEIYRREHNPSEDEEEEEDDDENDNNKKLIRNNPVCYETRLHVVALRLPRDAFVVGNIDAYDESHPDPSAPLRSYLTETWTFRHEIGIPNDIMPETWKNLKKQ